MHVAVAGGTGLIGRQVVRRLAAAGHTTSVLARSTGVDLVRADGLTGALDGVDTVVDVTSTATVSTRRAVEFFGRVTRNLLAEERRAGVGHHLALSIVGIDSGPSGYWAGKLEQERLVRASSVPWTIVRATQFHDFPGQVLELGRIGPAHVVPRMRTAPVSVDEVADLLVEVVGSGPRLGTVQIGGPRAEVLADLARRVLRARGCRHPVLAVPFPGAAGAAMRRGGALPRHLDRVGRQSFEEWLKGQSGHPGSRPETDRTGRPDPP